jgi:hypothetical protein
MKVLSALFFIFSGLLLHAQSVPPKTPVSLIAVEDINYKTFKESSSVMGLFIVENDVVVDGKVVISAQSPVNVIINMDTRSELKITLTVVRATDGSMVKIDDCWLYTTRAENTIGKPWGPIFRKGTRKVCKTL